MRLRNLLSSVANLFRVGPPVRWGGSRPAPKGPPPPEHPNCKSYVWTPEVDTRINADVRAMAGQRSTPWPRDEADFGEASEAAREMLRPLITNPMVKIDVRRVPNPVTMPLASWAVVDMVDERGWWAIRLGDGEPLGWPCFERWENASRAADMRNAQEKRGPHAHPAYPYGSVGTPEWLAAATEAFGIEAEDRANGQVDCYCGGLRPDGHVAGCPEIESERQERCTCGGNDDDAGHTSSCPRSGDVTHVVRTTSNGVQYVQTVAPAPDATQRVYDPDAPRYAAHPLSDNSGAWCVWDRVGGLDNPTTRVVYAHRQSARRAAKRLNGATR